MENEMIDSQLLIYENQEGDIRVDVRLEDETVWLSQEQMGELFGKARSTIAEHIGNVFKEGELDESMVCREFRQTTQYGAIEREISHQMALEKSGEEYDKFKENRRLISKEESLKELEADIKDLKQLTDEKRKK